MKIKELIEALNEYPADTEVVHVQGEYNNNLYYVRGEWKDGKLIEVVLS